MWELAFLLLPVAALSGWYVGKQTKINQNSEKQSLSPQYFAGLNYLLNEQPDKAIDVFLQVLDLDDEMLETHLTLGNLFRKRGEVERATRIHQNLLARPTLSKDYRILIKLELAKDYISAGVLDRAEKLLLELSNHREQLESSLSYLVRIYQQGKDWEKAIKTAVKLQSISQENLSATIAHFYCEMSEDAILAHQYKVANKYLKMAMSINSNCARASILQGNLEQASGNFKAALKAYKRVGDQNSSLVSEVILKIGQCYDSLGDPQGMLTYLQDSSKKNANILTVVIFSDWLSGIKDGQKALKFIYDHLRKDPSIRGLNKIIQYNLSLARGQLRQDLQLLHDLIEDLFSNNPQYRCSNCGFSSRALQWHCPSCKHWDTLSPIETLSSP